jgi:hypothetical protein
MGKIPDMRNSDEIVDATRRWLADFVIGLNLCPFAAAPFRTDRVFYRVVNSNDIEGIFEAVLDVLRVLVDDGGSAWETALVITPAGLEQFDTYLDAVALIEDAVVEVGLEGEIQVASFHPAYRFEGAPADDPANYTNRSPYPMMHLIREPELEAVLRKFDGAEQIPRRNVERLRALGIEGIQRIIGRR